MPDPMPPVQPSSPDAPGVPAAPAVEKLAALSPDESDQLVRTIGMVFSQALMYGSDHSVTKKAMELAFNSISNGLVTCHELQFAISDDAILVNNVAVSLKNPLTRGFASHLTQRDIRNFSFVPGLDYEKFTSLVDLLNQKAEKLKSDGGFAQVIGKSGIDGIRAAKVSFVQVTEDDVVISKDTLRDTIGNDLTADRILSLLKKGSNVTAEDREALRAIQRSDNAVEVLGEAIVGAATPSQGGEGQGAGDGTGAGGSMIDSTIQYMQQTYEALADDPSVKTQKGKKALLKLVNDLEEEIRKRVQAAQGELSEADATKLAEAVEGMTDELKIDALASEYMKKRSAIDSSEKRLLRFIKTKGLEKLSDSELRERLLESGFTMDDWRELLAKSGLLSVGQIETTDFAGMNVSEHLAGLLQNLSNSLNPPPQPPDVPGPPPVPGGDVASVLSEINREVGTSIAGARARIDQVIADFQADARTEKTAKPGTRVRYNLSRRRLMTVLAEVGQELCQPLAVMNCTIEMLINKSLGDVTETQLEMLKLANDGGIKLKQLADKLIEIAGLPETMNPDAHIQDDLYDR